MNNYSVLYTFYCTFYYTLVILYLVHPEKEINVLKTRS